MDAVTVVIPTRNRRDLLAVTLTSVIRQRDVDMRVIVVDDASTDDSRGVVERMSDARVTVVRQPVQQGVSRARNLGVDRATTTWVAFCDDDDVWSANKLGRQVETLRSTRRDWAYAGCVAITSAGVALQGTPPLPPEAMREALCRYNAMPAGASNVIARTEVVRRLGGFDPALTHLPDWDLWLRLARHGLPACVDEPLVGYRIHGGNASFRTAEMLAELDSLEQRHEISIDRSKFHRHLAYLCFRSGRRRAALGHMLRALFNVPDGLNRVDIISDARLLRAHASEIVARRLGSASSTRTVERHRRMRARDPHARWKAQAQAWLDELR